jgi:hypothetical protein
MKIKQGFTLIIALGLTVALNAYMPPPSDTHWDGYGLHKDNPTQPNPVKSQESSKNTQETTTPTATPNPTPQDKKHYDYNGNHRTKIQEYQTPKS